MSARCLLLIDPPSPGAWNMAVDEALLERAFSHRQATLRFYQWSDPTLSLGYSQRLADRAGHPPSASAPIVRRLSGGGALVHDRELTYSLCLPAASPHADHPSRLYLAVHEALIDALADFGVSAQLYGRAFPRTPVSHAAPEPFLCFARRSSADVVLAAPEAPTDLAKIVGSAQRRVRGAVLQHGALLLARSPAAPELPGLNDVARTDLRPGDLIEPWSALLAQRLRLTLEPTVDRSAERLDGWHGLLEKYSSRPWTYRR